MTLYKFEKLRIYLNNLGFPEINESQFKIFRKDFSEEEAKGTLKYKDGRFYFVENGHESIGYFYLKTPDIERFGFPKFHITECSIIKQQKDSNLFNNRYFLANNNVVDLIDRETKKKYVNQKLELCYYCRQIFPDEAETTQDFYESLILVESKEDYNNFETDIFGYTFDWHNISKTYKKLNQYTCNNCKIKMEQPNDFRFIHVHHKNGNKKNNHHTNLECLCIRCHSNIDENHFNNFQTPRLYKELENFNKKFPK